MRYGFLIGGIYLYSAVLFPVFWYMWIYQGSGNANFVYAITLVYGIGQIVLVVDLIYAFLRRQWDAAQFLEAGGNSARFLKNSRLFLKQL